MHHDDRAADLKFFQRFIDQFRLHCRRRILKVVARAPAVTGTVDQDHAMMFGEQIAERPHRFEIRAGAMDHHDRRAGGVAWPEIDDAETCAGNLDGFALRRIDALQGQYAGLRDQRQNNQRRHA
jgi:hypothetical protein